jgi:hypothetical protein
MTTRVTFLECGGNSAPSAAAGQSASFARARLLRRVGRRQALHLLDEAGIDPKANWFIGEGADAPHLARSVPLKKGLDDAMIALEPYLHLIEPGGVGRRKMEMDLLCRASQRSCFGLWVLRLSKITWISRPAWSATKAVHEIQELDAPAALVMAGLDQASGNIERGEQGRGPVPIVGVAEPCHRFAIGQLQPALGALQSLDVRLLVDRKHHRVLGRRQVEPDNVGCPSAQTPDRC